MSVGKDEETIPENYCGSAAVDAFISQCYCGSAIAIAMHSNSITFIGNAIPKEKRRVPNNNARFKGTSFPLDALDSLWSKTLGDASVNM